MLIIQNDKMKYVIDRYIGFWKNEEGYRLEIRKKDETNALASLFAPSGHPISRPYMDGKETVDMPAIYDDYIGDFDIQLWNPDSGFCLNLHHFNSTRNDNYGEELLSPGLTRHEEDNHLEPFYALYGKLSYYKRQKAEQAH